MDFTDKQIRPPKAWQKLEDLCHDLFKLVWKDPLARKNGRTGQPQHGVDIYSSSAYGGDQKGVQVKGKDETVEAVLTLEEFTDELVKAEQFQPPLKNWVLVHSGPKDAKLEEAVRLIAAQRVADGQFPVDVLAWEDLVSLIGSYEEVIAKHYSEHLPVTAQAKAAFQESTDALAQIAGDLRAVTQPLLDAASTLADAASPKPEDAALHARIDEVRDWLNRGRPSIALEMLEEIERRHWEDADDRARFRILTNRGAAYLEQGELTLGAEEFLKAYPFAPEDPKAGSNVALAHSLKGDAEAARKAAWQVITDHPTFTDAYAIWIRAVENDPDVQDPLSARPAEMPMSPSIYGSAAHFYRTRGADTRSLELLREGVTAHPDNETLGAELATSLVEAVMRDPRALYGRRLSPEQREMVSQAVDHLRRYLDKHAKGELTQQTLAYAVNLVGALRVGGDYAEARSTADAIAARAPGETAIIQEQVRLRLLDQQFDDAVRVSALAIEPSSDLLRMTAEALVALGRHTQARQMQERAIAEAETDEVVERLRLDVPRMLWAEGKKAEAREIAEALVAERPDDPRPLLVLSEINWREDDVATAAAQATAALELTEPDDVLTRLLAAEALYTADAYDLAAEVFRDSAGFDRDNHPLRRLVSCLLHADRRRELEDLLNGLPPDIQALPLFVRAAAYVAEAYGDLPLGRERLEAYLALRADDHHARLRWIDLLARLEDVDAITAFMADHPELPGAGPEQQMTYAHRLSLYGFGDAGLELAYRTLRQNYGVARMHLGYIGLFLSPEMPGPPVKTAKRVAEDTAFTVKLEDGETRTFVIESQYAPDPARGEVAPGSAVAQAFLGKKKKDAVALPGSPVAQLCRIMEVKDKHLHQLHQSTNGFNAMFPDEPGFIVMKFNKRKAGKTIDRIRSIAEPRSRHVRKVADGYRDGGLPIAIVAELTGVDPIDAWRGLVAMEVPIHVCVGTAEERELARGRLQRSKGVIVDPLTLWIAGALDVLDPLSSTFGPLHMTQSSLELLVGHCRELERAAGKESMSMGVVDGELTRTISSAEDTQKAFECGRAIVTWAQENVRLVRALPKQDFVGQLRDVCESMHPAFGDTLRAADGESLLFLCEDMHLRQVAALAKIPGIWLQPSLMECAARRTVSVPHYERAVCGLAEARHEHIALTALTLMSALKAGDWDSERSLAKVVRSLGGPGVDLTSCVGVSGEFFAQLFRRGIPPAARAPAVRKVLEAFLAHHADKAERIADGILSRAESQMKRGADSIRHRSTLRAIVREWKKVALRPTDKPDEVRESA